MNMVTADDVANESEYNEILEDIRGECGNYGTVKAIVIPREGPGIGKVKQGGGTNTRKCTNTQTVVADTCCFGGAGICRVCRCNECWQRGSSPGWPHV